MLPRVCSSDVKSALSFFVGSGSLCFVGSGTSSSLRHKGKAGYDSATILFISSKVLNILKSTKRKIGPDIRADMCHEIIISSSLWIQWVELVEYMDTYIYVLSESHSGQDSKIR